MKTYSLSKTVNYLGTLPGDSCIRVWYQPAQALYHIIDVNKEGEKDVPIDSALICGGQPEKFFQAIHMFIFNQIMRDEDTYWKKEKEVLG